MDNILQEKYDRLLEIYPMLPEGEKVMMNMELALQFAIREGILYRYAQNGEVIALRWTQHHMPFYINANAVPIEIVDRAIILAEDGVSPGADADAIIVDEASKMGALDAEVLRAMAMAEDSPEIINGVIQVDPIDATESAIKLAEDYEIDLQDVDGSGKEGRVTLSDVRKHIGLP